MNIEALRQAAKRLAEMPKSDFEKLVENNAGGDIVEFILDKEFIMEDTMFENLAGNHYSNDKKCEDELFVSGIPILKLKEFINEKDEVVTSVRGKLGPWSFKRAWRYWVAEGKALPLDVAIKLHEKVGKTCRVGGHCYAPHPLEYGKGFGIDLYHVDDINGLKALSNAIASVMQSHALNKEIKS
jgi:hypothetical protein